MPTPLQIIYTYEEDGGKTATNTIYVPTSFSLSQYTEAAVALASFLDKLVHGKIKPIAELCVGVDLSSITGNSASATSDVEEVGEFIFSTPLGRNVSVNIPGIKESVVVAGSHAIDQANVSVAAFVTDMLNGIAVPSLVTVIPCDVGEDDLDSLLTASERFRNSGSRR